jgi:hypothetical protein
MPFAITFSASIIAASVLLLVIVNTIENDRNEARSAKSIKDLLQRERDLYSMPMAELDAEIARLEKKRSADHMSVSLTDLYHPSSIRRQRLEFDSHPDAKLLPDGVQKLARLKKVHEIRFYSLETKSDTRPWDKEIAKIEAEFTEARRTEAAP